jgi:Ras-related protein Rab-1A
MSSIGVDFKTKQIEVNDRIIKMQIWDTAGHEKFRTINTFYYKSAHAIIVLYDITDESSFEHIKNWMIDIDKFGKQGVLKVLIGNKIDLEDERKITKEEGESMANKYGIKFFEVSAKDNINIDELFLDTAKCLIEKNENAVVDEIGSSVVLNNNKINMKKNKKCC